MRRPTGSTGGACASSKTRSSSAPGRSGLAAECGLARGEPNQAAIAKLDAQLCDIKELSIRDGLHVFGQAPDAEAQGALVEAMVLASGTKTRRMRQRDRRCRRACGRHERAALLAALDGRRVAPGPAGAPTRGRADVLPTGRNLTSIDPRAIPTRTAAVDRRARRRRGGAPLPAGSRRVSARAGASTSGPRRRCAPAATISRRRWPISACARPGTRPPAASPASRSCRWRCSTGRAST